ncbi:uncharacterized protein G2W53_023006 [Senna tora]|uniref:Uncharacterized protein n=1 Tax=Senna tora TaxID=362788 RepID=A0A834TNU9_9FABA|nr:uncharacterized protein G2W53_023006 [Senna tora]
MKRSSSASSFSYLCSSSASAFGVSKSQSSGGEREEWWWCFVVTIWNNDAVRGAVVMRVQVSEFACKTTMASFFGAWSDKAMGQSDMLMRQSEVL